MTYWPVLQLMLTEKSWNIFPKMRSHLKCLETNYRLSSIKYYTKFRFVKIYIILLEHVNVHFLDTSAVLNHFIIWYWPMHPSMLFSSNLSYIYMIYHRWFFRNLSYHTRVQLAILDHNIHLDRPQTQNTQGENICTQGNFASKVKNGIQHQPWQKRNMNIYNNWWIVLWIDDPVAPSDWKTRY